MKFIEVSSDWPYGARNFESSGWDTPQGRKELFDLAMMNEGQSVLVVPSDLKNGDIELNIKALNFGPVDKKFFMYVMTEFSDREWIFHTNIYMVEE